MASVLVAGAGACSSGSGHSAQTVVKARADGSLGPILTTSTGMTLYMFPPDTERHVTCTGTCALTWPPLTVLSGNKPKAGAGVQQSLLGTDPNPNSGTAVVTYDGWPLYTFSEDVQPGQTSGQALFLNGGYWYVMAPSGQPLTVKA
jgi:predicted lipoprotein with Yx(FWY)xxD motif